LAFSYENPFCVGLLYGRAGRLTAENGGFRPGQSIGQRCSAADGTVCGCVGGAG
jgi:hypothetical protein